MRNKFSKIGLSKRELNNGLTNQQIYWIFHGIVIPQASKIEQEAKEKNEELKVPAFEMAQNMLQAMIFKYGEYSHDEKLAFVRMARKKFDEIMEKL